MRIMVWMCCIEASAGIYESTRLGEQGSPGYIWQSTIRISTTTKYTLILPRSHSGSTANGETGEEAESRSQRTNTPPSHNVYEVRMLRLERKPMSNSCGW